MLGQGDCRQSGDAVCATLSASAAHRVDALVCGAGSQRRLARPRRPRQGAGPGRGGAAPDGLWGATIVVDCVGGRAGGVQSFAQAQDMLAPGGLLQLIGPTMGSRCRWMQRRSWVSACEGATRRIRTAAMGREAMLALGAGEVRVRVDYPSVRWAGGQAGVRLPVRAPGAGDGVLFRWA